jgi:D-alanyl-D-alanine carboxypeptidase
LLKNHSFLFKVENMKKIFLFILMILIVDRAYGDDKIKNQIQKIDHKKKSNQIVSSKQTKVIPKKQNASTAKKYYSQQQNNKNLIKKNNINKSNIVNMNSKVIPKTAQAVVKKTIVNQNNQSQTSHFAVLAVDANTGEILFSKNAHEARYPASLTKLMTLYMIFDLLDRDRLSLNDKIRFSRNAASKPRSKLGVQAGDYITLKEAINALIVLSANDVAAAVAEHISGSEIEFAKMMTRKARFLKMYKTNFYNPSGLFHPSQKTTAADMIKLGIALKQNFPQYYKYFSKTSFNFRGREINGHNRITANYPGAEGLKTGYISQSGFNLISSASRDQKTVFATVLGGKTSRERDAYMEKLLDASFTKASKKARL